MLSFKIFLKPAHDVKQARDASIGAAVARQPMRLFWEEDQFRIHAESFQRIVFLIHSPGRLLPLIEWAFIFAPLLFHAIMGVWIARTGRSNSSQYQYTANRRYTWQRWTGFIALVFGINAVDWRSGD